MVEPTAWILQWKGLSRRIKGLRVVEVDKVWGRPRGFVQCVGGHMWRCNQGLEWREQESGFGAEGAGVGVWSGEGGEGKEQRV